MEAIMQGRPQLFRSSKQISVLVSGDDYRALAVLLERARVERPGYSFGDLLRAFIRQRLDQEEDLKPARKLNPTQDRVQRLHAIARAAVRLAHELDSKKGQGQAA
jgi:hypothetical protein